MNNKDLKPKFDLESFQIHEYSRLKRGYFPKVDVPPFF